MTTNRKFTWKEISHRFKLYRSYSISFNLSKVGEIFWVESERTVSKSRQKENENFCVVFTNSVKWARETRKFQKKKSVMQSCRFANINLRIFCRSRYRRRRRCLSSGLLWSKHFATMVTWRHTLLSSVSLGATLTPEGNWTQCLCKLLEWQSKSIMVCYVIFCSGQLQTPWMKRKVFSVTFRLSTLDWWNVLCLVWCLLFRFV